jgi:hypothetical protein
MMQVLIEEFAAYAAETSRDGLGPAVAAHAVTEVDWRQVAGLLMDPIRHRAGRSRRPLQKSVAEVGDDDVTADPGSFTSGL